MTHQTFNFNLHNTQFFGQYWKSKQPKAAVLLVHGMGEHSSRYANFIVKKLVEQNISVITFDHFGHGKTGGKRGHNPSFEAVLDSVSAMLEKSKEVFGDIPIYLYGHSMGGNVVLNYALRRTSKIKGIIATSPFLKLAFEPPKLKLSIGKLLQKITPSMTMGNELNPNDISRDKIEVQKYIDDPLIHSKISPNYSITFIKTGKWALENAQNLQIPTVIFHGTGDKIIDYKASKEFVEKSDKATIKLYEEGYHELHNDLCKEELISDIIDWINNS
ncbi:MAG: lysophospholipase [Flavobacteriaceae bacterium]|nr:lysophospholipase [Flavobacteriaceae bacterium]